MLISEDILLLTCFFLKQKFTVFHKCIYITRRGHLKFQAAIIQTIVTNIDKSAKT